MEEYFLDSDESESAAKDVFVEFGDYTSGRTSLQLSGDLEQARKTSARRKRAQTNTNAFNSFPSKSPEVEDIKPPPLRLNMCEEDRKPLSLDPPLAFLADTDMKPSPQELMLNVERAKPSLRASVSDEEDVKPSPLDLIQITVHGQQCGTEHPGSPVNFWTLLREDTSSHSDEEPKSPASGISLSDGDSEWEPEQKSRRKRCSERATDGDCDRGTRRTSQNFKRTPKRKATKSSFSDGPTASNGKTSIASSLKRSFHSTPSEVGQWRTHKEKDIEPTPLPFRPTRDPGPQHSTQYAESPLDFFRLFFTDDVIKMLVENTNAYGSQHILPSAKWTGFTSEDMFSFLSIVIFMGLLKLPQLGDYWRTSRPYNIPFPISVMTRSKFLHMCRSLHMCSLKEDADNQAAKGTSAYDHLGQIKPLYSQILKACKTHFHPDRNLCINERMVIPNEGLLLKENIRNKYIMGHKLFVLADAATGYIWNFYISEGVKSALQNCSGNDLPHYTVMSLMDIEHLGTGYHLYVDGFYTSPLLFRDLFAKSIGACGCLSQNKMNFLQTMVNDFGPNAPRGSIRWIRDGELLFVKWKETQEVALCSTIHKAYGGETVHRRLKKGDKFVHVNLPIPPALTAYKQHMGGQDPSDGLISHYNVLLKTKKWYRTFFYHFVDVAVVNAHILYNHCHKDKCMTQREFRDALVQQLADNGSGPAATRAPCPEKVTVTHKAMFLSKGLNLPKENAATFGRRRCALCHKKTPVGCETCDVALCFVPLRNCYGMWHMKYGL